MIGGRAFEFDDGEFAGVVFIGAEVSLGIVDPDPGRTRRSREVGSPSPTIKVTSNVPVLTDDRRPLREPGGNDELSRINIGEHILVRGWATAELRHDGQA